MKNILLTMVAFVALGFGASAFAAGDYNLENVTNGNNIRGVVTSSSAVGHASVWYSEGEFSLYAKFKDLTDPKGDDFYEGWLVQKSPFQFISTGELTLENGNYINEFDSSIDYSSYDFYVLTLEPNDGDPAPADHIFEGTVVSKTATTAKHTATAKHHDYNLENVVGDAVVRGISTSSDALGHAAIAYEDGQFALHAEFAGLTDPLSDDFYEGWLVQRSPFQFISTGELYKKDGKYHNRFESNIDYSSYDFYVLTLEPNDGNDAPADHIIEGVVLTKTLAEIKGKTHDTPKVVDSPARKLLKANVVKRIANINLSERKIDLILSRIDDLEDRLPTLNLSDTKKAQYVEILSVLKEVLLEKR